MIHTSATTELEKGRSNLSGRLLWAYRVVWVLAAAFTLAALSYALPRATMEPLVLGLRIVKSAILIGVAGLMFWRRQRDPVAAILAIAFLCWAITSSVDFTSGDVLLLLLDRLRFLLFALALLLFPDGNWRPRWTRPIARASAIVFGIGTLEGVGLLPTTLFLPLAIVCVLTAIGTLVQRFRTTSSETQRLQLKWVALGLISGVGLIVSARAAAALSGPQLGFEAMFQLGIVFVALGFLVPLLKYRLYDAETFISRSAGYALLTASLVAVFSGSEALIENIGQQYLGSSIGQVSGALAAALAAVLIAPLNERISTWAENRFQRDLVQLKRELPELLSDVPLDWSPRKIGEAVLPRICESVHAESAAIVLSARVVATHAVHGKNVTEPAGGFPLCLPIGGPLLGEQGTLLIGPRPDRTSYAKDEIEVLRAILPSLRRALVRSAQRESSRRSEDAKLRSLRAGIAQLSKEIAHLRRRV